MRNTADVVVIGGGVHGASVAFRLAERKAGRVLLLEKNGLAAGPTSKSGAMIRPLFSDRVYVELVMASTRMFERWKDEIGGDPGFVQNGFLRITESLSREALGGNLDLAKSLGPEFEILDADRMRELAPMARFGDEEKGVIFPRGGYADPQRATIALARAAEQRGAEVFEGVSVTGIEVERGAVKAVRTDQGRISAPTVVNCAGAWSHRVAAMAGVDLPIEVDRVPTYLFRRPETMPEKAPVFSDGVKRIYLRFEGPNLFRAAHFGHKPDRVDPDRWDESVGMDQIALARASLGQRSDSLGRVSYGGFSALYDMTPDGHPIVGQSSKVKGFWCNCGWSGNGFAPAPAAGLVLSRLILDGAGGIDLSTFDWPRRSGAPIRTDAKWTSPDPARSPAGGY